MSAIIACQSIPAKFRKKSVWILSHKTGQIFFWTIRWQYVCSFAKKRSNCLKKSSCLHLVFFRSLFQPNFSVVQRWTEVTLQSSPRWAFLYLWLWESNFLTSSSFFLRGLLIACCMNLSSIRSQYIVKVSCFEGQPESVLSGYSLTIIFRENQETLWSDNGWEQCG